MANYDIADHWEELSPGKRAQVINLASDEQLKKWASDPDCNQMLLCGSALVSEDIRSRLVAPQAVRPKNERVEPAFNPRTEQSEDDRPSTGHNKMEHLNLELRVLSLWDLTCFAWKCWWAVLLASIPIAVGALLIAAIIAGLNRP